MKKPSRKGRRRRIVVARRRTWRRKRWAIGREKRRAATEWLRSFDWIMAPAVFSIEDEKNRAVLIKFLDDLRRMATAEASAEDRHGRPATIRIDFSRTWWMTAPGTLLFAAELQRMKVVAKRRLTCSHAPRGVVAQVLQHVGIFQILGHGRTCKITADIVRYWEIDSGDQAEGEQADKAMQRYRHLFDDPNQKLYRALTEAMVNCRQHAYEEERGDGLPNALPNWWMFSQHNDGKLTIAFGDLGIGIPRSLPINKTGLFADIRALLQERREPEDDHYVIRAAMEVGHSRTALDHRGKGLMDMRSVLDEVKGTMHIHSNRGSYKYDAGTGTDTCTNFGPTTSIRGTIVVWEIPIPAPPATQ